MIKTEINLDLSVRTDQWIPYASLHIGRFTTLISFLESYSWLNLYQSPTTDQCIPYIIFTQPEMVIPALKSFAWFKFNLNLSKPVKLLHFLGSIFTMFIEINHCYSILNQLTEQMFKALQKDLVWPIIYTWLQRRKKSFHTCFMQVSAQDTWCTIDFVHNHLLNMSVYAALVMVQVLGSQKKDTCYPKEEQPIYHILTFTVRLPNSSTDCQCKSRPLLAFKCVELNVTT